MAENGFSNVDKVDICLELICLNSGYLYYFLGSSECSNLLEMIWSLLPDRQIDQAVDLKCISSNFANQQDWSISGLNRIADVCPGAIRYWMKGLSNKNLQKEIQLFCQNYLSETLVKKELKNVKVKQPSKLKRLIIFIQDKRNKLCAVYQNKKFVSDLYNG